VPEESYAIPFGKAAIVREGSDVTIVGVQKMVHTALEAAEALQEAGINAEVIDPRTYSPLDTDTILASVAKTGRLIIVDESHPRCSLATDISALAAEHAFDRLLAPVKMVTGAHAPVPFSPPLEDHYLPSKERIVEAVMASVNHHGRTNNVVVTA
jgi:pyruvate dehydrogenase E1 component beta subunit